MVVKVKWHDGLSKKEQIINELEREFGEPVREDLIAVFKDQLKACCKSIVKEEFELSLTHFYGPALVGKTKLISKIQSDLEKDSQSLIISVDARQNDFSVDRFMQLASNQLFHRNGFKFPLFDLARSAYCQKVGENIQERADKSSLENFSIISDVMKLGSNFIPVLDMTQKIIAAASQGIAFTKKWVDNHKEHLLMIEKASPRELEHLMPLLFTLDLEDNMRDIDFPIVVFLDHFESLKGDEWIRGGIDENGVDWSENAMVSIPKLMWVFAGREPIKWPEDDPDWDNYLKQVSF